MISVRGMDITREVCLGKYVPGGTHITVTLAISVFALCLMNTAAPISSGFIPRPFFFQHMMVEWGQIGFVYTFSALSVHGHSFPHTLRRR